jgi:hypothetical protein
MVNRNYACISRIVLATVCLVAGTTASVAGPSSDKEETVYKWVDEKGVVHYGDSVPAQYASRERRILNEHGVEVGVLEAQKSADQLRADENQRRLLAGARQRDQILLTTYVSAAQIEQLRDERLDVIEGQVKVTTQYLDTLQGRMDRLHSQALFFKPYSSSAGAGPMPDQLAADLIRTVNEIRAQKRNLDRKKREQETLRAQFQADLDRYRQLKSAQRPES